ncbi:MAG TPA: FHA domain-containing protein [Acidimicrobiales bacterium]|nr:FHA domain-containing protein [Acidimicrobiales bacterium]
MSEPLLNLLKICLLVLLYLFFLRVLQAVWSEVNGPRTRAPARARAPRKEGRRTRPSGPTALRVLDPEAERGRTFPLADELTVGRAAGCHITLDDTFVSQLHARVFRRDGGLYVEDLGSTNGTYLNRSKVSGPMAIKPGDRLQVGSVVMELT